jgi:hypothetical protein
LFVPTPPPPPTHINLGNERKEAVDDRNTKLMKEYGDYFGDDDDLHVEESQDYYKLFWG